MQSRRPAGLTPLAIVLPHPPLPHRRSSLLSLNSAASPHTPRSCASPSLYYPANRKSTDSWNSSNADDMDFEWKPEQVLLLSRTLDALPAHLVTPFNGPIPPSNLLDKIARGVSQAKGPADWPHSIRATRIKLLELARARAKEEALAQQRRQIIREEVEIDDGSNYSYFHDGEEKPVGGPRRPLYRQSSMDFIKPTPADIRDNASIARLSNRLQRSDRVFPNPTYHPYSRTPRANRRSSSPPHAADVPPLINPSTPSSSTLNSISSLSSSAPRLLHRSSTISSGSLFSSSSGGMPLSDPRLQRVRRSDSLCSGPPAPPPKDYLPSSGFKRAPSYGALAQEAKQERSAATAEHKHVRQLSGSYPSSDEEEKARTRRAKKMRTKTSGATPSTPSVVASPPPSLPPSPMIATAPSSPVVVRSKPPVPPAKDKGSPKVKSPGMASCTDANALKSPKPSNEVKKSGIHKKSSSNSSNKADGGKTGKTENNKATHPHHPSTRAPMNLQRNPSMFGPELPHLRNNNNNAGLTSPKLRSPSPVVRDLSPAYEMGSPLSSPLMASPVLSSPTSPKIKTLRRVRRLAPARRISFGSLAAPGDDADGEGAGMDLSGCGKASLGLGSAFQLL
ncbi:hypothetical protein M413DRAFT_162973 [Hebeloma cylindrosporum]|uniref:Uncharacterized protein n=1 Tax=Hebeloma cylindrosporum TaxID=76867 RepID=A0A0C3C8F3_HEBCY|nr:hypothetical protein M413DRAFT_162973 [Hebeloma cylindrosporum h7]